MQNKIIKIIVAYATPLKQYCLEIEVKENCSVLEAIHQAGILSQCPEIHFPPFAVGIFSKTCCLTDKVNAGDRIEIYRPLIIDPKEARRQKAKKG